ncbi:MAG: (Fe-S)-binding protein [Bacteroidota bacterium]|jgi:glycolate oxidase iron-sulfur subunit
MMAATSNSGNFLATDIPNDDFLTQCMHCGLCLPVCPTFAITGREKSSPRGRIRLIKSVAEGKLGMTEGFIDEMNFCLDCQACETACPAGVKYGALVESARNQIRLQGKQGRGEKILKKIFLRNILSNKNQLKFVAKVLWIYQNRGIEWFLKITRIAEFLTPKLSKLQELSPRADREFFDETHLEVIVPRNPPKYKVGFLSGCLMNVAFSKENDDTIKILLHHDCEIIIPKEQVCCGSLQAHNGDFETARELAKKNVDVFTQYQFDAIVMNSAGCGAFMKEYGHYLHDDPVYAERAASLSGKIKDISEFLFEIGLKMPEHPFNKRVTYHDACHLVHAQKISQQPRTLLKKIPGLQYVELPEASWCCGSAGIYNVTQYEDSMIMLDRKMTNLALTECDYVVANNPGCLTQMQYGIRKQKMHMEVIHFVTLLRKAYGL